MILKRF